MSYLPHTNIYDTHPDDGSTKEVYLQASGHPTGANAGDRHVLLWWRNGTSAQIIQLSGKPGNYSYISPIAFPLPSPSPSPSNLSLPGTVDETHNQQVLLGRMSRAQRDQVLQLAKEVRYERGWVVNGGRVWMRDLLLAIVGVGIVPLATFTMVDRMVPLVKRRAE